MTPPPLPPPPPPPPPPPHPTSSKHIRSTLRAPLSECRGSNSQSAMACYRTERNRSLGAALWRPSTGCTFFPAYLTIFGTADPGAFQRNTGWTKVTSSLGKIKHPTPHPPPSGRPKLTATKRMNPTARYFVPTAGAGGGGGTSAVTWRRHGESAFRAKLRNTPPHPRPTYQLVPGRQGEQAGGFPGYPAQSSGRCLHLSFSKGKTLPPASFGRRQGQVSKKKKKKSNDG